MPEQSFLSRIVAHKQAEIRAAQQRTPLAALETIARAQAAPRDFRRALASGPNVAVIAELKKASPSAGVLRADFDVTQLARSYAAHGAAALSVLTDATYFQGHLAYLEQAAAATSLPILRKDFLIDSYQIVEARAFGADAVLLIAALLSAEQLHELLTTAQTWGMAALVEVHDEREIQAALAAGAGIIGINNRDLHTFAVNLATAERLAAALPSACVRVAESGISSRREVERLAAAGIDAILIGSHLMRQPDPGRALSAFTGVPRR
ncbi:MAG: indole-3-glycerol phosphate synthase TrpC [candidate division KSB1 bacterium]|nr:indole-3-glycerol phosphate synthase TrpC [candidate division KSB1 bacterium]MDZ7275929.1 indole-3-glycerol phosphate synthase TrpC [candidate division KSB1 bacterium]MDZ7285789.1 indole-3-glycerol phosphate synthase TrpC [candidate division KSB1 bacterium]MDZ7298821.1 indole-3-glycerol phosphate synthase TrpC [candidate division KSB1 bacterium]MDZ7308993.1 indole-3-glycerol phosphate synthase TrpC [candidate division KSB1 bacterium]